ncbi:MAG: adenosylcobinamide-phosphate synthase CbiB [Opitutales bacterium]
MWSLEPWQLLIALALDLLLGDPRRFPHITRLTGNLAAAVESVFNRRFGRGITSGSFFLLTLCLLIVGGSWLTYAGLSWLHPVAGKVWAIFIVYQAVAATDLRRHVKAVWQAFNDKGLNSARKAVGWIVGRDTANLDESGVSRAAIEAVAESANDAAIAPLFWAVIGGAGGALLFRVVNTLDSMVGHRDDKYETFGKASARADDLLGLIPARLCAVVSAIAYGISNLPAIRREAGYHASPNAGWPEAAIARALNVRLGGANTYDNIPHESPTFHATGKSPGPADIHRALRWFTVVYTATVVLLTAFSLILHL